MCIRDRYRSFLPADYVGIYEEITLGSILGGVREKYTSAQFRGLLTWIKEVLNKKFPRESIDFEPTLSQSKFETYMKDNPEIFAEEALDITIGSVLGDVGHPVIPHLFAGGSKIYTPGVVLQSLAHVVGFFYDEVIANSPDVDEKTKTRIMGKRGTDKLWRHIESEDDFKYLPLCFGVVHRSNFSFGKDDLENLKTNVQEYAFDFGAGSKNWKKVVEVATSGVVGRLANVQKQVEGLLTSVQKLTISLKGGRFQEEAGVNLLEQYSDLTSALATAHQEEYDREEEIFLPTKKGREKISKVKRYKTGLKE